MSIRAIIAFLWIALILDTASALYLFAIGWWPPGLALVPLCLMLYASLNEANPFVARVARIRNPFLRCALATPVWLLSVGSLWLLCLRHGKWHPDWALAWGVYTLMLEGWDS